MVNNEELNPEAKKLRDGIEATIVMCKWVYDLALEHGFNEKQSMEMTNNYLSSVLTAAASTSK